MEDGKLMAEIREAVHDYAQRILWAKNMRAQIAIESSFVNWIFNMVVKARKPKSNTSGEASIISSAMLT